MRRDAKASSAGSTSGRAGGPGWLRPRILALLCLAVAVAMTLFASSALAVKTHPYTGTSFGPNGTAGSETFTNVQGVAVDQTSASANVYVYDAGAGKIYKFDAAGEPVNFSALAANAIEGVGGGGGGESEIAIAPAGSPGGTAGDIYAANNSVVKIYAPSGVELGDLTGGETCGVATAPNGHVFVGVYSSTVREYTPTANPVTNADQSGENTASLPSICNVAADGLGNVYAANYNGGQSAVKLEGLAASSATPFASGASTLGIDPSNNDVYADRGEGVDQYGSAGNLIASFAAGVLSNSHGVAVNGTSGKVYVGGAGGRVAVYGLLAILPGDTLESPTGVTGTKATLHAAVNPDNLAVSECKFEYGTTAAYGSSKPCEGAIPTDGANHPVGAALTGLAFNTTYHFRIVATNANGANQSSDETFTTSQPATTGKAVVTSATEATLNGTVAPEGTTVSECKFEYGPTEAYGSNAPCAESSATIGTGESQVPVHADLTGLTLGVTYHFRLIATSANGTGTGADRSFEIAKPAIENEWVASAGLTEATLAAKINPKGVATTYHLEYGTDTSYGTSTPEAPIGSEEIGQTVSNTLEGLPPATAYHWRVVATNAVGVIKGPDRTFATYVPATAPETDCPTQLFRTGPGAVLPDCRAYEQASPIDKHGANVEGSVNVVQASGDGNRITFADAGGLASSGGSSTPPVYFANRGAGAWSTNGLLPITEPGRRAELLGWDGEITTAASRLNSASGFGVSSFDTATGTAKIVANYYFQALAGFADDPEHLIAESSELVAPGAIEGKPNLYDLDHGVLTLAGRIPVAPATSCDDAAAPACVLAPEGSFAGPYEAVGDSTNRGGASASYYTENTISDDGSKVFFTAAGSGQLYLREDGTKTTQISASQASTHDPNGHKPAAFMAATPSGSKVFFTSCEKLTDDSTAVSTAAETCTSSEQGQDLYSYDTGSGDLTDLTVDSNAGDPQHAGVIGVLGTSADGSYVYFAANGVLAPGGSVGNCSISGFASQAGTCNLYVAHAGTVTFIAPLNGRGDSFNWLPSEELRQTKESRVAADGTLIFGSTNSLTGYDNAPAPSGPECPSERPCSELYRYDPAGDGLSCVSCNPTGVAPEGQARLENVRTAFGAEPKSTFLTRNISPDGKRVFFDSPDPLVVTDTNGVVDPYEWEADGTGSCKSADVNGGCLYLLSTGTSTNPSFLGDISTSGEDAFIFTSQPLVPVDKGDLVDVYDVRVDGGLASQHPNEAPACLGEACKGASTSAPNDSTAGSAAFNGPGNQREKPKQKKCQKHSKQKCKKSKKHKKSKSKKSRAANTNRGGSK